MARSGELPKGTAGRASSTASSAPSQMGLGLGLGTMGLGLLIPTDPAPELAPEPSQPSRGVLRLRGAVQHYEWGWRGGASLVACHAGGGGEGGVDPDRPYAELWMGTHPSAPSSLASDDDVSLREWLARSPAALLGRAVAARWGGDLPFLFKVLSVAKALSIQAHQDRELARALHALRPATYPDGNHKPELAVAVTEFRALCGFAGIQELKDVLRTVPEVWELVGKEEAVKLMTVKQLDGGIGVRSHLQSAFTKLMTASKEAVSEAITKLKSRLNADPMKSTAMTHLFVSSYSVSLHRSLNIRLFKGLKAIKEAGVAWRELNAALEYNDSVVSVNGSRQQKGREQQCSYSIQTINATRLDDRFVLKIPCGLIQGSSITIIGTHVGLLGNFKIELTGAAVPGEPSPPIVLHYNVRLLVDKLTRSCNSKKYTPYS